MIQFIKQMRGWFNKCVIIFRLCLKILIEDEINEATRS